MKIALCGSLNFTEKFLGIKNDLEKMGHEIVLPNSIQDFSLSNSSDAEKLKSNRESYMKIKPIYIQEHFKNIAISDAVLVVNEKKKDIKNYVGAATFAEIMMAFHYGKKIFFLNPLPTDERLEFIKDEIEAVKPIILKGDLSKVKI